jgi:hypothetical protein
VSAPKEDKFKVKHGFSGHPLYNRWCKITQRCNNPHDKRWASYGAKGIKMEKFFGYFPNFVTYLSTLANFARLLDDPRGWEIDRIDPSKGYERGNLQVITAEENNRRKSVGVSTSGNMRLRNIEIKCKKTYTEDNRHVKVMAMVMGGSTGDHVEATLDLCEEGFSNGSKLRSKLRPRSNKDSRQKPWEKFDMDPYAPMLDRRWRTLKEIGELGGIDDVAKVFWRTCLHLSTHFGLEHVNVNGEQQARFSHEANSSQLERRNLLRKYALQEATVPETRARQDDFANTK